VAGSPERAAWACLTTAFAIGSFGTAR